MGWRALALSWVCVWTAVFSPSFVPFRPTFYTQWSVLFHSGASDGSHQRPRGTVRTLISCCNLSAHLPSKEQQNQTCCVHSPVPCPWGPRAAPVRPWGKGAETEQPESWVGTRTLSLTNHDTFALLLCVCVCVGVIVHLFLFFKTPPKFFTSAKLEMKIRAHIYLPLIHYDRPLLSPGLGPWGSGSGVGGHGGHREKTGRVHRGPHRPKRKLKPPFLRMKLLSSSARVPRGPLAFSESVGRNPAASSLLPSLLPRRKPVCSPPKACTSLATTNRACGWGALGHAEGPRTEWGLRPSARWAQLLLAPMSPTSVGPLVSSRGRQALSGRRRR